MINSNQNNHNPSRLTDAQLKQVSDALKAFWIVYLELQKKMKFFSEDFTSGINFSESELNKLKKDLEDKGFTSEKDVKFIENLLYHHRQFNDELFMPGGRRSQSEQRRLSIKALTSKFNSAQGDFLSCVKNGLNNDSRVVNIFLQANLSSFRTMHNSDFYKTLINNSAILYNVRDKINFMQLELFTLKYSLYKKLQKINRNFFNKIEPPLIDGFSTFAPRGNLQWYQKSQELINNFNTKGISKAEMLRASGLDPKYSLNLEAIEKVFKIGFKHFSSFEANESESVDLSNYSVNNFLNNKQQEIVEQLQNYTIYNRLPQTSLPQINKSDFNHKPGLKIAEERYRLDPLCLLLENTNQEKLEQQFTEKECPLERLLSLVEELEQGNLVLSNIEPEESSLISKRQAVQHQDNDEPLVTKHFQGINK
jgi:hypothetical protein